MIPPEALRFIWYPFDESSEASPERILWEELKNSLQGGLLPTIVTRQGGVTWFGWDHTADLVSVDQDRNIHYFAV